jgi:hypothetical protein
MQDGDNDIDLSLVGGDGSKNIQNVEENESLPFPQHGFEDAADHESEKQKATRGSAGFGALPGRVSPHYCALCNVSFMASWKLESIVAVSVYSHRVLLTVPESPPRPQ